MARLHDLKHVDIDNCYWGMATTLWFNGCPHKCLGCHNENTWHIDDKLDRPNQEVIDETLVALDEFGVKKDLTLLGGDPLSVFNLADLIEILAAIKEARPETRVLCWTGYTWKQLQNGTHRNVLKYIDILIDGRYEKDLHVEGHKFGSSNQKVIDVQASLATGSVVYAPEDYVE